MTLVISTEPMDHCQVELTVEVDQERVDRELRKAARKVAGDYRIPGFRKGKAPYSIVVQYVGLPALYNEFVEDLGKEVYLEAIEQAEIEPYAIAALDIASTEPLTYKLIVPLEPVIDLGDYRSLRVEEEAPEVTDEEIEEELNRYREQYAGWAEVDRPTEYGDMLTIDVRSVLVADDNAQGNQDDSEDSGETVVLDETDWDVTLDQENPMEPPGFDEALIGLKLGEEKEFTLGWPENSQSIHAGKEALFRIKVQKVQAHQMPDLDDDLAQLVGPDFQSLDDLKTNIRESLQENKKAEAENAYLETALDMLVAQSTLDYPPVVIEDQIDMMVNEFERQLRQYGIDSLDTYLSQIGQSVDDYRGSLREQAEITAKRNLVISELFRQEGIEATDEDVEQRIEVMVGSAGDSDVDSARAFSDMMREGSGRAILESQVLQEKSLERLLAIVRGEEIPEPVVLGTQEVDEVAGEAADDTELAAEASDESSIEVGDKAEETPGDDTETKVSAQEA